MVVQDLLQTIMWHVSLLLPEVAGEEKCHLKHME
jgi:hypothetical protein